MRIAFDRPEVRNAFRPHTVDELLPRPGPRPDDRPTSAACCSPATARSPKDGGWAFCSGGDQRIRGRDGYQYAAGDDRGDRRPGRAPGRLHILEVPAADPVHAEGRHRRGARAGPPAAATRCTSSATSRSPAPSTPASSRPTPTSGASTAATARPTWPARSARSSPARSSSSARTTRAERRLRDGRGQRGRAARRAGGDRRSSGRATILGKSPDRAADAQVLVQPDRRRPGRPAAVRRRGDPAGLHDRRGRSRAATRSSRSATRTGPTTRTTSDGPRAAGAARADPAGRGAGAAADAGGGAGRRRPGAAAGHRPGAGSAGGAGCGSAGRRPDRAGDRHVGVDGCPKGALLSSDAIKASAMATHARLGGPGTWLLAMSPGTSAAFRC